MDIASKLETIERDFMEIDVKMADPVISMNPKEIQALGKKRAQLEPVVEKYREYRSAKKGIIEARSQERRRHKIISASFWFFNSEKSFFLMPFMLKILNYADARSARRWSWRR
ncbi:hypothetical protein FACS1894204_12580 [Synergistales bacterium]|nr:hypothetical protein FACS1894204_12580 [Synergistales bacterium]